MDTSETYVKMCDCPEIQGWEIFKYNSIPQSPNSKDFVSFSHTKPNTWENIVWLPRQDQIQKMLEKPLCFDIRFVHKPNALLYYLTKFRDQHPSIKYETMEQLWLAFYMHEKHGKIWNGEKWEKI